MRRIRARVGSGSSFHAIIVSWERKSRTAIRQSGGEGRQAARVMEEPAPPGSKFNSEANFSLTVTGTNLAVRSLGVHLSKSPIAGVGVGVIENGAVE